MFLTSWQPPCPPRSAENRPLTAGGFQDTTRIAAGDPQLWTAILLANAEAVADGVRDVFRLSCRFPAAL